MLDYAEGDVPTSNLAVIEGEGIMHSMAVILSIVALLDIAADSQRIGDDAKKQIAHGTPVPSTPTATSIDHLLVVVSRADVDPATGRVEMVIIMSSCLQRNR